MNNTKHRDLLPDEFKSYEEAAEFWGTHDTIGYLDAFETVDMQAEFHRRHYEVELDEELVDILRDRADKAGISVKHLVSELLRQQLQATT